MICTPHGLVHLSKAISQPPTQNSPSLSLKFKPATSGSILVNFFCAFPAYWHPFYSWVTRSTHSTLKCGLINTFCSCIIMSQLLYSIPSRQRYACQHLLHHPSHLTRHSQGTTHLYFAISLFYNTLQGSTIYFGGPGHTKV